MFFLGHLVAGPASRCHVRQGLRSTCCMVSWSLLAHCRIVALALINADTRCDFLIARCLIGYLVARFSFGFGFWFWLAANPSGCSFLRFGLCSGLDATGPLAGWFVVGWLGSSFIRSVLGAVRGAALWPQGRSAICSQAFWFTGGWYACFLAVGCPALSLSCYLRSFLPTVGGRTVQSLPEANAHGFLRVQNLNINRS